MFIVFLLACSESAPAGPSTVVLDPVVVVKETVSTTLSVGVIHNTCPDYAPSWVSSCPTGSRCITFKNSCAATVYLSYNIGCNSDGTQGAPQCSCTPGPVLVSGASAYWIIVDGNYPTSPPSWTPACLTSGLAVLVNEGAATCTTGSRVEFTAGNTANEYGRFDAYNLDIEKDWYSVPVSFSPSLVNGCAKDSANHDCRPLWCDSSTCPDAYATPTTGGCPDGRSPQAGCQDTFSVPEGFDVEYCPASGKSCQDAKACPPQ
jgi:hypothetical protein